MNSFTKNLLPLVGLVALSLVVLEAAADLTSKDEEAIYYEDDWIGYDTNADTFYYVDKHIDSLMERKNLRATKLTLGGQSKGYAESTVLPATNPFVVAQRSLWPFGTNMDRWDVKDDLIGKRVLPQALYGSKSRTRPQYFGMYHGKGSTFVVNKLRAHLLRTVANSVDAYLTTLNLTDGKPLDSWHRVMSDSSLKDNIVQAINEAFVEVDTEIRDSMADNDNSKSSATVVIVTEELIITASVGTGNVVAYTKTFETSLIDTCEDQDDFYNVFGAKNSRKEQDLEPRIAIHRKDLYDFLIIENPTVANMESNNPIEFTRIVTSELGRDGFGHDEQDIFTASAVRIMDSINDRLDWLAKFKHSDYAISLVVLNRNYASIK